MQLTRAAILFAVLAWSSNARAQDPPADEPKPAEAQPAQPQPEQPAEPPPKQESAIDKRASLEIGGYQDSVAVSVLTPSIGLNVQNPTAGWGINGRYLVDVVSAASPDIVSTASPPFHETRHGGSLGARYKPGDTGVSVGAVTSYTPDYLALGGSGQITHDLFDKNLTLVGGYAYGADTIGKVNTPYSVFHHTLQYHTITVGASDVVNPAMIVGVYIDTVIERGDQSKPYRYVPMFSASNADKVVAGMSPLDVANLRLDTKSLEQLPLERERYAVTGRLAYRFTSSTLRLEERVYYDTWGLAASTTEARFFVDLSQRVMVWPHLRANVQNGASFYKRVYVATGPHDIPTLRTTDRELSPLETGTAGGGFRWALGKSGSVDDFVLQLTLDGAYTAFNDALYVKSRLAALAVTTLEVAF